MKLKGFINSKSGSYDIMHDAAKMLRDANFVISKYNDNVENHFKDREYSKEFIRNYKSDPISFLICTGVAEKLEGRIRIKEGFVFSKYLESYSTALGAHAHMINKTLDNVGIPIVDLMEKFYKDENLEELFINFITPMSRHIKMKKDIKDIISGFKQRDTDITKHHMRRLSYVIGYNNFINKVNKWCTTSYKYSTPKLNLSYQLATNKPNGKRKGKEYENSYIDEVNVDLAISTYYEFEDSISIVVDFDSTPDFEEELKSFYEGETKNQLIERRVRNKKIVKIIKDEHMRKNNGKLPCQDCGYCFSSDNFNPYVEAHHIKPFASKDGKVEIKKEDFVLLCPNCHVKRHQGE